MKHLRVFESFLSEEQIVSPLDPGEFDPMKFKVASSLFTDKIGKLYAIQQKQQINRLRQLRIILMPQLEQPVLLMIN